jgi:hypothetical protein
LDIRFASAVGPLQLAFNGGRFWVFASFRARSLHGRFTPMNGHIQR